MKKKLLSVTICFWLILTMIVALFLHQMQDYSDKKQIKSQLVVLNEIEKLTQRADQGGDKALFEQRDKALSDYEQMLQDNLSGESDYIENIILIMYVVSLLFLLSILGYVYYAILRPFEKMKDYVDEIARGNFEHSLKYERSNYFGAFTWAFDNMRKEVMKARKGEKEAILNNKTVIAAISHDIKTPVASIRAYSEGLAANLDSNAERRANYISVIIRKCDEVTKLTSDLLLHSVSDLDQLKINPKPENIRQLLMSAIGELDSELYRLHLDDKIPDSLVMLDVQRFEQVLENLIGNATKYSQSAIDISARIEQQEYIVTIRDYGEGVPDEDMPFVFDKFYRGKNVDNKQGSGLGLYISKYIMKRLGGDIKLYNHNNGLEVILSLPICIERI